MAAMTNRNPFDLLGFGPASRPRSSMDLSNWTPLNIEPVVTPWSPTLDILYYTIPDITSPSFIKVEINRAP
jgi:hypothetical protein